VKHLSVKKEIRLRIVIKIGFNQGAVNTLVGKYLPTIWVKVG
jgi:hypothetical protein